MNEQKQVAIAVAIVMRGDQVIISQRPEGKALAGYWEFPGGKVEAGERARDCAVREVMEEVGARVKVVSALSRVTQTYDHATVCIEPFVCQWVEGEPRALECAQVKWVGIDELGQYRFPPANDSMIAELKRMVLD